ncbi:uncharacterized protein VTP21DRAFT_4449 [Calcarisporiella thermophila]|uniref:uncharacterized protein n=1 Tax=Calcarisporiella thermophila TaxID=911321 RepID=UPI00374212B1
MNCGFSFKHSHKSIAAERSQLTTPALLRKSPVIKGGGILKRTRKLFTRRPASMDSRGLHRDSDVTTASIDSLEDMVASPTMETKHSNVNPKTSIFRFPFFSRPNRQRRETLQTLEFRRIDIAPKLRKWRDAVSQDEIVRLGLDVRQCMWQEIAFEIIVTEEDYVRDLKMLFQIFIKPIRDHGINVPHHASLLFNNIRDMIILHQLLLEKMEDQRDREWPVMSSVVGLFEPHLWNFAIYTSYLCNLDLGIQQIERCITNNEPLGVFLKEQMLKPECRNLTLQAFMVKPVQRLTKYPLFLKNLLENKDPHYPDYEKTSQLLTKMEAMIHRMQEEKRKEEEHRNIVRLFQSIKGSEKYPEMQNIPRDRSLLLEGDLMLLNIPFEIPAKPHFPHIAIHTAEEYSQPVHVFLFNDMLLLTRFSASSNQYKMVRPPARVTHVRNVTTLAGDSMPPKLPAPTPASFTFGTPSSGGDETALPFLQAYPLFECTLVHRSSTTLLFYAVSDQERALWVQRLAQCVKMHTNRTNDEEIEPWWYHRRKRRNVELGEF